MNKKLLRKIAMLSGLAILLIMLILSVNGSFQGAEKARLFFNTLPLQAFWGFLTVALLASLVIFPRVRNQPGMLAVHLGCILVLLGSMWASETGHRINREHFGSDKIAKSYTYIYKEEIQNKLYDEEQKELATLPFDLYLNDFRVEYYWERGKLYVYSPKGESLGECSAVAGEAYDIGSFGQIEVKAVFKNYRRGQEGQESEGPEGVTNPALRVVWKDSTDSVEKEGLVFERFKDFQPFADKVQLVYVLMPKDYISDIKVVQNDKVVASKAVEVNYPLHYGGYYFFQHSYDSQSHAYTILSVTSDNGFGIVFTGYFLLCGGLLLHCWGVPAWKWYSQRQKHSSIAEGGQNGN